MSQRVRTHLFSEAQLPSDLLDRILRRGRCHRSFGRRHARVISSVGGKTETARKKGSKKGVRYRLCEAPFGPFRQSVPDPFFRSRRAPHDAHTVAAAFGSPAHRAMQPWQSWRPASLVQTTHSSAAPVSVTPPDARHTLYPELLSLIDSATGPTLTRRKSSTHDLYVGIPAAT